MTRHVVSFLIFIFMVIPPLFLLLYCYFSFPPSLSPWTGCQCIWINVSLCGASGSSNNNRWQTCVPIPSRASGGNSLILTCLCMQLIHTIFITSLGKEMVWCPLYLSAHHFFHSTVRKKSHRLPPWRVALLVEIYTKLCTFFFLNSRCLFSLLKKELWVKQ